MKLGLLGLIFVLLSCSKGEIRRWEHRDPGTTPVFSDEAKIKAFAEIDLSLVKSKPPKERIETLRPFLLQEHSEEVLKDSGFIDALEVFNEAILELKENDPQLLADYQQYLLPECPGTCTTVKPLKKTPTTSLVLLRIASKVTNEREKYDLVFVAYDLSSNSTKRQIDLFYLQNLKNLQDSETVTDWKPHLAHLEKISIEEEGFGVFNDFKIWEYKSEDSNSNVRQVLFPKFLNSLKNQKLRENWVSYLTNQANNFRTKHQSDSSINNLGISLDKVDSVVFTLIEIYNGILESSALVKQPSVDDAKLAIQIITYLEIKRTIETLSKKFVSQMLDEKNTLKVHADSFTAFLADSQKTAELWMSYRQRLKSISNTLSSSEEQLEIKSFTSSLDQYILMALAYPMMMPVMYYISLLDVTVEANNFWYDELHPRELFSRFFDGISQTWFQFVEDVSIPLTRHQVLISFKYALELGVFEKFKVPIDKFLIEAHHRMVGPYDREISRAQDATLQVYVSSNLFKRHLAPCDDIVDEESLRFSRLDRYIVQDQFEASRTTFDFWITDPTEAVPSFGGDAFFAPESNLLLAPTSRSEFFDSIRLNLFTRLKALDFIGKAASANGVDTSEFDRAMNSSKEMTQRFLGAQIWAGLRASRCQRKRLQLSLSRQKYIVEYEKLYLSDIYEKLQKVKKNEINLSDFNKSLQFDWDYPDDYSGFDYAKEHDGDLRFHYHKLDFMHRMREYFLKGYNSKPSIGSLTNALMAIPPPSYLDGNPAFQNEFNTIEIGRIRVGGESGIEKERIKRKRHLFNDKYPTFGISAEVSRESFIDEIVNRLDSEYNVGIKDNLKYLSLWSNTNINELEKFDKRLAFYLMLKKFGKIKIFDYNKCSPSTKKPSCFIDFDLPYSEITEEVEFYATITNMKSPLIRSYLETLGRDAISRDSFKNLVPFILDPVNLRPTGIYNYAHMALSLETQGDALNAIGQVLEDADQGNKNKNIRVGRLADAKKFYSADVRARHAIFAIGQDDWKQFRKEVKSRVDLEFSQIQGLEDEAAQKMKSEGSSFIEYSENNSLDSIQIPWFEPRISTAKEAAKRFHRETENLFKN